MANEIPPLPHLQMVDRGISQDYKSKPGRGKALKIPGRNRATHGSALRKQLQSFVPLAENLQLQREAKNLDQMVPAGIVIEFQSAQGFDLAFKSLDLPSEGIELLNFKEVDNIKYATCFVPEGKLAVLVKKVREYMQGLTPSGKPKNHDLVASIQSIGVATVEAFWTDEVPPPEDDTVRWWEVWLRREDGMEAEACLQRFTTAAVILDLTVAESWLAFPDRVVTNMEATRKQLARAAELLNLIAEIRRADLPPALPHEPTLKQQDEFVDSLAARIQPPADDAVALAILDTGINRKHPLIEPALNQADLHAVDPDWGTHDHHGHGTQMAGVALYGDLRHHKGQGLVPLPYRLESVKILPPQGQTPGELFGAVTEDAVAYCEIEAPQRARVFCKAITSPMHQDGLPSSYSAAVDQLAFGGEAKDPRLFVVAAGNVPEALWTGFPNSNLAYGVEQPGQAWNALTVGACTHIDKFPGNGAWAGWTPVASAGELSPFSATSYPWNRWPIKPEVVVGAD
jgi:hypothetical protein